MTVAKRHPEATWISERELIRDKFKKFKMESGQRGHLADSILLFPDSKQIAIEIELTMKGSWRLDKIISHYVRDFSIKEVWYFCAPEILRKMRRAMGEKAYIKVFSLRDLLELNDDT